MAEKSTHGFRRGNLSRFEPFLLAAILLVAALFRFHALDEIPPGLTHDEADVGFYAAAVARGEPTRYDVPYGYAYEPFGQYSAGLLMRALGATDYTLRVHQTLYGLLVVGLTYAWARMAFGWAVAAGASAVAAVLFWTVFTSRMALNSQPVPAVFLLAVIALWRALYPHPKPLSHKGRGASEASVRGLTPLSPRGISLAPAHSAGVIQLRWRGAGGEGAWWVVFALSVATMLHIYEAARVLWFALPAFAVYLWLTDWARLRRRGRAFALALGVGTALALPHLLDPGAWGRTEALGDALTALRAGNPGPLIDNVLEGLGMLTVSGDVLTTYNIPGRPVLGPVMGLLFYVGVLVCLARLRRRPACAFLLIWLAFGLVPTLIVGAYTSTLHSIAVQPVVCILPAVGAVWLIRRASRLRWRWGAAVLAVMWVAVLVLTGAVTAHDYFTRWGESAGARAAYFHALAEITARVDADPEGGVVAVSSPFPEPPLDPFIGQLRVHNPDVDVRWMDARLAVTLPAVDEMRLITMPDAPLDSYLADLLRPEHVARVDLRPDDLTPYYDVYRLDLQEARARLAEAMPAPDDAIFGGVVAMRGCLIDAGSDALVVVTRWEVLDPGALGAPPTTQYAHELKIFVHALDAEGRIAGQADVLGAPASDWRAGDVFVHVHRIAPLPEGDITLLAGVYNRVDGVRLPLAVGGEPAGDALPLDCSP